MNCAACGDKLTLGTSHECWVWNKVQTQTNINTPCGVCGCPEYGGLTHRECYPDRG